MKGDAQFLSEPAVRFERLLPGSPERVWQFLTDSSKIPGWYGEGSIEARAGGTVTLMGGHVRGVITQWHPGRKLAYTWNVFAPNQDKSDYPESYLTFEIEPKGNDEVLLSLVHLPILERFEKQNAMGWHTYLDMLEDALRNQPVKDRSEYMKRNASKYEIDLGNLVK